MKTKAPYNMITRTTRDQHTYPTRFYNWALFFAAITFLAGFESCSILGIGKQCFICTTEGAGTKVEKEVCGNQESIDYAKANTKVVGGVLIQTICRNK